MVRLARRPIIHTASLAMLITLATVLPVWGTAFTTGDLYLVTNSTPATGPGILRIAMPSGTTSLHYSFLGDLLAGTAVYDPYRDLILFMLNGAAGLRGVDADGNASVVWATGFKPQVIASRGDGTVYLWSHFGDGTDGFFYLDASNAVHDLLDPAGTARYALGSERYVSEMIYEPHTNSLVCLTHSSTPSLCADGSQVCIAKLPLSSNGQQVIGAAATNQFEVSASGEVVVGSAYAPGGKILVTVDTNSLATEPRMQLLDPTNLALSVFASNNNAFAASINAGTYSHVLGRAVVDDTGEDVLRSFAQDEASAGTIVATGVSGGGTGEFARLLEINGNASPLGVSLDAPPSKVSLAAAPNPMRYSSALRYSVVRAQHVTLAIRDLAGRTVRTLVPGDWREPGYHTVSWDGRDATGARVPPGIYWASIRSAGAKADRPLVVLQ